MPMVNLVLAGSLGLASSTTQKPGLPSGMPTTSILWPPPGSCSRIAETLDLPRRSGRSPV